MLPDNILSGPGAVYQIAAFLFGYLLGSIAFGVIVARIFGLGDLRAIGSGNIGATNVLRTGNKKAAALTLVFDALKGAVPVLIVGGLYGPFIACFAALGAMIGHCFPVWLRFRGGKGVATFLGVVLALHWPAGILACAVWLAVAAVFRYSSLAALVSALSVPLYLLVTGTYSVFWVSVPLALLLWLRHHANIRRLLTGTESRIGARG